MARSSRSSPSVMLPSSASSTACGRVSRTVARRDRGDSTLFARRPEENDSKTPSPSTSASSSRTRRRRSSNCTALTSKRMAPALAPASSPTSSPALALPVTRSSMLRTPSASRAYVACTPRALIRSITSLLLSKGITRTARAASSTAANSSSRPASESRRAETFTASRGKNDNSIGPSMASVR